MKVVILAVARQLVIYDYKGEEEDKYIITNQGGDMYTVTTDMEIPFVRSNLIKNPYWEERVFKKDDIYCGEYTDEVKGLVKKWNKATLTYNDSVLKAKVKYYETTKVFKDKFKELEWEKEKQ